MNKAKKILNMVEVSGDKYTVVAGRQIYKDNQPFIGIQKSGDTEPTTVDRMVHVIVGLLNKYGEGKDSEGPKTYYSQHLKRKVAVPED